MSADPAPDDQPAATPGGELPLPQLTITNYRCFRHLEIPALGRVNLIVGMNGVGKSTLLEAIRIHFTRDVTEVLRESVISRNEVSHSAVFHKTRMVSEGGLRLNSLFHGRPARIGMDDTIRIAGIPGENRTIIRSGIWFLELVNGIKYDDSHKLYRSMSTPATEGGFSRQQSDSFYGLFNKSNDARKITALIGKDFIACMGVASDVTALVSPFGGESIHIESGEPDLKSINAVPSARLPVDTLVSFWSKTTLTEKESHVVKALHCVNQDVDRINLVSLPGGMDEYGFLVKLKGQDTPLPLRTLGEGINRILDICLALVNTENGVLLIDEIETGLHWSTQEKLWQTIFHLANALKVQVFVTTHSYDAIEAFQQATVLHPGSGMLVKLENRKGDIQALTFDEREIALITKSNMEIR